MLDLPADEGILLIQYAFEKEDDDKLFTLWVGSRMYLETSFEEFKTRTRPARIDEKAVLERIDRLMESAEWVKG